MEGIPSNLHQVIMSGFTGTDKKPLTSKETHVHRHYG